MYPILLRKWVTSLRPWAWIWSLITGRLTRNRSQDLMCRDAQRCGGFVKKQSKKPWRGEQRASLRFPWKSNPHRSCLSHKLISGLCEPNNRGQTRLTRSGGDVPGATRCPQPLACGPPGWQPGSALSPWAIMGSVLLLAQPGCSRSGRI